MEDQATQPHLPVEALLLGAEEALFHAKRNKDDEDMCNSRCLGAAIFHVARALPRVMLWNSYVMLCGYFTASQWLALHRFLCTFVAHIYIYIISNHIFVSRLHTSSLAFAGLVFVWSVAGLG